MTKSLWSWLISTAFLALPASGLAGCASDSMASRARGGGSGGEPAKVDAGSSSNANGGSIHMGGAAATGGSSATDGATATGGTTATGKTPIGDGGRRAERDADIGDSAVDRDVDAGAVGGDVLALTVTLDKPSIALRPGSTAALVATVTNDPTNAGVEWSVAGGYSISSSGQLAVAANASSGVGTITATSNRDPTKKATARLIVVAPGVVTATAHPLVASYAITSPLAANLEIQFGESTAYEKTTSQTTADPASQTTVLVGGMVGETTHHLRAALTFDDGTQFIDEDHTFTTGTPMSGLPVVTATIADAGKVTPGIELVSASAGPTPILGIDLQGRVVWYYPLTYPGTVTNPVRPLANGHYLAILSPSSTAPLSTTIPAGAIDVLREFDLAGDTVRELTLDQLANELTAAVATGCAECDFIPGALHHEALPLPNGHTLILTNTLQTCAESTGCTGGDPSQKVLGDVVVDLDEDWKPVWAWNEFKHLSVGRDTFAFPDWSHSNAIVYSADDGAILVSIRHLALIVKVAYGNGTGDGHVIWKLGNGGDFALEGGTAPQDWFNAQHGPSFASTTVRSGTFPLVVLDNGTFRPFEPPCSTDCSYSRAPIFEIDETAKTAKIIYDYRLPAYTSWGGNAEVLSTGNVHVDMSQPDPNATESDVYEITQTTTPEVVMRLNMKGLSAYRSYRLGSLYPGVVWY